MTFNELRKTMCHDEAMYNFFLEGFYKKEVGRRDCKVGIY